MTLAEMREHLAKVTYRPGWKFDMYEDEFEGPHIFIVAPVPNTYGNGTIDIGVRSAIPPLETPEAFDRWLLWRLIRIESHEAREFFKVDGRIVFDPHDM